MPDFVSSQTLVIIRINMEDSAFDALVFRDTGSGLGAEMLVISAPVNIQDAAECLDVMLETQLVDSV
jgi:hypothetical protein